MSTYHAKAGESLWTAIRRVKADLAEKGYDAEGALVLNGITLRMHAFSDEYDIVEKYDLLRRLSK